MVVTLASRYLEKDSFAALALRMIMLLLTRLNLRASVCLVSDSHVRLILVGALGSRTLFRQLSLVLPLLSIVMSLSLP